MKKILVFILLFVSLTSNAQWRRQYVPASDGYPSEWNFIYESGDLAVDFAESGILMLVSKVKTFKTSENIIVTISVYDENMDLISKGQYNMKVLPNKHACGSSGFKHILHKIRNEKATIKVTTLLSNGYFNLVTSPMYAGQQVKFNLARKWTLNLKEV